MKKPTKVEIFSIEYKISYFKNANDVNNIDEERALGMVDFRSREIRLYDNADRNSLLAVLFHEILHVWADQLDLVLDKECYHKDLNRLSVAMADTFIRNGWLKIK